jgi:hypothetical protein
MLLIIGNVHRAALLVRVTEDSSQLNVINYTILGHCFHWPARGQCVVIGVLVKYTSCGNSFDVWRFCNA